MKFCYDFGEDFEYEADDQDIQDIVNKLLKKCDKDELIEIITENYDLEDYFEEKIEEELRDKAEEDYKDWKCRQEGLNDWFGTKKDVIGL